MPVAPVLYYHRLRSNVHFSEEVVAVVVVATGEAEGVASAPSPAASLLYTHPVDSCRHRLVPLIHKLGPLLEEIGFIGSLGGSFL